MFMRDIRKFTEETVAWFADKDRSAMRVERRVVGPVPALRRRDRRAPEELLVHLLEVEGRARLRLPPVEGGRRPHDHASRRPQEYVSQGHLRRRPQARARRHRRRARRPAAAARSSSAPRATAARRGSRDPRPAAGSSSGVARAARTSRAKRRSRWSREGRTNATPRPAAEPLGAVPDRGLRRRDRREGAQLRVHLVEEQEEARLRLRDLEDPARTRS